MITKNNRIILKQYLTSWGMEADVASGGDEGILRFKDAKNKYDLLLLDCRMPDLDGFETAEKIKNLAAKQTPVIVMLTSDNRDGDLRRSAEAGFSAYVLKPISRRMLLQTIQKVLLKKKGESHSGNQTTVDSAPKNVNRIKLLLVDDSEENRDLVTAFLRGQPIDIEIAENGQRAIECHAAKKYDVILMDMQMPDMDGYMTTRAIRAREADKRAARTRIIALTANAFKEDREKCLQAGCDDYLSKPVRKNLLIDLLLNYSTPIKKAS